MMEYTLDWWRSTISRNAISSPAWHRFTSAASELSCFSTLALFGASESVAGNGKTPVAIRPFRRGEDIQGFLKLNENSRLCNRTYSEITRLSARGIAARFPVLTSPRVFTQRCQL